MQQHRSIFGKLLLTHNLRVFYSQNRYPSRIKSEGMLLRNTR